MLLHAAQQIIRGVYLSFIPQFPELLSQHVVQVWENFYYFESKSVLCSGMPPFHCIFKENNAKRLSMTFPVIDQKVFNICAEAKLKHFTFAPLHIKIEPGIERKIL